MASDSTDLETVCKLLEEYLDMINSRLSSANSCMDEGRQEEALEHFEGALLIVNKALDLDMDLPPNSQSTFWEKISSIMNECKSYRIEISKQVDELQTDAVARRILCSDELPEVGKMKIIYWCHGVQMYYILPNGDVQTTSELHDLCIFRVPESLDATDVSPGVYMQVGKWVYPLFTSVSPCFQADFRAFVFPDISSQIGGAAVGVVVPADEYDTLSAVLELVLKLAKSEGTIVPFNQVAARARRDAGYASSISQGLVSGARYISGGLLKGAEKTGDMISYVTPKLIENITPEANPRPVPDGVRKGAQVAKNITKTAASVTGFMATKVGEATAALGRYLAPHIERQGTRILSSTGMPSDVAAERVSAALQIAGGAVEGFTTVYEGLSKSAGILATSLASNTVNVVQHKYGEPMGEVTENTFDSLGSLLVTSSNIKMFAPKRLIKQSVKEAGRAAAGSYPSTSASFPPPNN